MACLSESCITSMGFSLTLAAAEDCGALWVTVLCWSVVAPAVVWAGTVINGQIIILLDLCINDRSKNFQLCQNGATTVLLSING